jgi:hypothetical protein
MPSVLPVQISSRQGPALNTLKVAIPDLLKDVFEENQAR